MSSQNNTQTGNHLEEAKKKAAYRAVDENISEKTKVVGIGSGSTVVYMVERLAQVAKEKGMAPLSCVPTGYQAKQLILQNPGVLQLKSLDEDPEIDIDIDGADELDKDLNAIKGGGGAMFQEKVIASCAKKIVFIADHRKKSDILGSKYKKLHIEVFPPAIHPVSKKIKTLFPTWKPEIRMALSKMGPVVSDNSNFIIDVQIPDNEVLHNPAEIDTKLRCIVGVIETGLFLDLGVPKVAYIGNPDGSVEKLHNHYADQ